MKNEKLLKEIKKVAWHEKIGRNGGDFFEDHPGIISSGPITKIEINHGTVIDKIQVYYGDRPGQNHGGTGGRPGTYEIKKGYNITQVNYKSGDVVDYLQFTATNEAGHSDNSEKFGGKGGGKEKTIYAPDGLVLREIKGRSGIRVDQLEFIFGHPFYIDNMKPDYDYIKEHLIETTPVILGSFDNNNPSDEPVKMIFKKTKTLKNTLSFSWQHASTFTFGWTCGFGLSIGAGAKNTFSAKAQTQATVGETKTNEESIEFSWEVPIVCPARKRTIARAMVQEAKLEKVPFTYNVVFYKGDKTNIIETVECTGFFSGKVLSTLNKIRPEYLELAKD